MKEGSWQPQGLLSAMIRRVPSRDSCVLWHTCSVLGQEGPNTIEFACGFRTDRNHSRTFWTFSSRNGVWSSVLCPAGRDILVQGMHLGVSLAQMYKGTSTKGKGTLFGIEIEESGDETEDG